MIIGLRPNTEPRQLSAVYDDLSVTEAGNRPFGYDPHSYTQVTTAAVDGGNLLSLNCVSVPNLFIIENL